MKPDKRPNNQNKTRQEKIKQLNWKQTKDQTIKMEPDQKPIRETGGWQETKQIDWRSAGNQTIKIEPDIKPNKPRDVRLKYMPYSNKSFQTRVDPGTALSLSLVQTRIKGESKQPN